MKPSTLGMIVLFRTFAAKMASQTTGDSLADERRILARWMRLSRMFRSGRSGVVRQLQGVIST